ncbi:hypothetical protein IV203_019819 [Nitzschia inconspicua]|uniref:Uncharacterized protein n=1 Tax=Nitzschia inconspicua TaxID=303405 RepID=A0A9K3Q7Q4_9STRA|nr:hypothetical protein IV203_020388 [Nitzschia inconspicua]KAG7371249.1 hypothetical protein IV203_019819 [Nitzschia inconspicua]
MITGRFINLPMSLTHSAVDNGDDEDSADDNEMILAALSSPTTVQRRPHGVVRQLAPSFNAVPAEKTKSDRSSASFKDLLYDLKDILSLEDAGKTPIPKDTVTENWALTNCLELLQIAVTQSTEAKEAKGELKQLKYGMVRGDGLRLAAKLERRALDMLFVLKGDDPTTEWRKKGKKPTGKFRSHGGRDQPLIFWNDAKAHTSGTPPGQQSIFRLLPKSAPTPAVDASRTGASVTVPMPAYAAGQQTWTSTAIVSLQKPSRLKPCSHSQIRTKQRRLNSTNTALAPAADSLPTGELAVMKNLDAEHKKLAALTDGHNMVLPSNNVVKPGLAVGLCGSFPSHCRMGGLVRASNANGVVMKHQCGMCGYFTHGALCCPNNVDTGSYHCYYYVLF